MKFELIADREFEYFRFNPHSMAFVLALMWGKRAKRIQFVKKFNPCQGKAWVPDPLATPSCMRPSGWMTVSTGQMPSDNILMYRGGTKPLCGMPVIRLTRSREMGTL
jgi:hypothetical protein